MSEHSSSFQIKWLEVLSEWHSKHFSFLALHGNNYYGYTAWICVKKEHCAMASGMIFDF